MASYKIGVSTRQAIIAACKKLFYEKGFHETSYSDICKAAHVSRTTIYYHFKTKESLRYEVQWEYFIFNKHIAEKYCIDERYHYIVALCLFWKQIHRDEKMRRFALQACTDFPIYTGKMDLTHVYFVGYESMWEKFWALKNIPELNFASMYGYIVSCKRMLCEAPERLDLMMLWEHCVRTTLSVWGFPSELIDNIWTNVTHCLSLIPEEEMLIRFD
jgi:hypothetical protein